ncbi:hypothetical protein KGY73_07060 [bacterium]|nr:hypothetical protein [bacterium]
MENILQKITLTTATSAFLIIASLWVLKLIIQGQHRFIGRALMVFFLFLLGLIYLQQSETGKITLTELKQKAFPPKTPEYNYQKEEGSMDFGTYERYIFHNPKPKISLKLDKSGDYFYISNVSSLNSVLEYIGLPKVSKGAPELSSITHSRMDVNHFRWKNYAQGVLLVEKSLCREKNSLQTFHCISTITVKKGY